MSGINLGKLERVEVRKAWEHEAQHFTPWLADNLDLLGGKLGISLELEEKEMSIDTYRADIVARNLQDDSRVLIENQLETADLQHLGQILAYMAGLDARSIVWVATGFNDIHRAAIRWLNEHTADPFAFFAVQVSIVKIGNSPLAPVFEVLERPNEWERQVQDASHHGELSEHGKFRREFWAHFVQRIPNAPRIGLGWNGSNVWHLVEEAELRIGQYLSQNRVGVYLSGKLRESEEEFVPRIALYAEAIKNALDDGEYVDNGENNNCSITLSVDDSHDRANWDQMVDWLDDRRRRYEKVLKAGPQQGL